MILHAESPRCCELAAAELISAELRRQTEIVGVFVNATLDELTYAADRAALSIVQLHGDEGPLYCVEAARRTGCRVMKVARVRDTSSIRALTAYPVDLHMLDAYRPGQYGGTGESFSWEMVPHGRSTPLVLSGGLDAENIGEAIRVVRPYAVDVASGTESSPGIKDEAKLRAFFRAVEQADAAILGASAA